jgi:hypothetical protein
VVEPSEWNGIGRLDNNLHAVPCRKLLWMLDCHGSMM